MTREIRFRNSRMFLNYLSKPRKSMYVQWNRLPCAPFGQRPVWGTNHQMASFNSSFTPYRLHCSIHRVCPDRPCASQPAADVNHLTADFTIEGTLGLPR